MSSTQPHLRSIVNRDGAVILDRLRNTMIALNPTGAYIWQRLEQGIPVDDIIADLARETNTENAAVARDVDVFLEELTSRHLLTLS